MRLTFFSAHPGESRDPCSAWGRVARGVQRSTFLARRAWVPAFAGMSGLIWALASPAHAADVTLRAAPAAAGRITLGDLFDGAGQASGVFVAPAGPAGGQAVLDAGAVQMAAKRAGLDWANAEGRRRIVVASVAAAPAPPPGASARAAPGGKRRQALAYARNLNAGDMVSASDLVWSDAAVAPGDAPSDPDAAIGKAARRPLREGAAVALHDLASPRVIKRDDVIDVAFEDEGISLVLQAKALGDAAIGDTVAVQNLASKKTLAAVASGPGRAVVGPAAEALKAAPFDAYRLASR